jgi:hypothetical protein
MIFRVNAFDKVILSYRCECNELCVAYNENMTSCHDVCVYYTGSDVTTSWPPIVHSLFWLDFLLLPWSGLNKLAGMCVFSLKLVAVLTWSAFYKMLISGQGPSQGQDFTRSVFVAVSPMLDWGSVLSPSHHCLSDTDPWHVAVEPLWLRTA